MKNNSSRFASKLFACWHPVSYCSEVTKKPFATKLLDEPLVIWRGKDGQVHAMKDLCIHRGTALSLGWVKNDCIVCPYHAWEYDKSGSCVRIPQAPNTPIPKKAKISVYWCVEKYGLIWVALKEPEYQLPVIPEFNDSNYKFVNTGPFDWESDASRQVENFTDLGHFPWVHPGLLGEPDCPEVPACNVKIDKAVLHYTIVRPESINSKEFPIFGNKIVVNPVRKSTYQLHLPYTIVLRVGWGGTECILDLFVSQPISKNKCRGFCIVGRNFNHHISDKVYKDFEKVIFGQDKRIVESQRPEQVPFDFTEELHLKFDAVAMNYRKAMKKERLND